ncbi:MAG: Rne/Rng family ribonuclease [Deltaproteobacteria bacterium]|nr:Rne/Rng family ribonuclease [Deltaproteobacteria bacterium]
MANELIVNVTLGETRVARLENGVVAELYIERARDTGILGNIYKGKVVRVLPGMQAAFVDLGLERTGFLHVANILSPDVAGESPFPAMTDDEDETAPVLEESAEETAPREKPSTRGRRRRRNGGYRQIQDLVKEGEEILVQVVKEPISTKGARLNSYLSLPGRHLVYMPSVDHIGVSRRIGDDKERRRLRALIAQHKPKGAGFIIRTASEGVSDAEIVADIEYLGRIGGKIEKATAQAKAPALVHAELDIILRVVRDLFTTDIDRLVIDSDKEYERIREFVDTFMPSLKKNIQLYTAEEPIFDRFAIEVEINRAMGQKVWLKSGGYIIIEQTEALTAIDVNTGRFVGRGNVEDTILKTNLEAVKEVVYQLRLRNIGGLIILDFIDMDRQADRTKVYNVLKEALESDRARTNITKISELGLVEMTRKRTREDLRRQLGDPCPYCEGKGFLKSPATVCYEIFREIIREARHMEGRQLTVLAHPTVTNALFDEERAALEDVERRIKKRVQVQAVNDFHLEQFEVAEMT